jgi:hypothetical protein
VSVGYLILFFHEDIQNMCLPLELLLLLIPQSFDWLAAFHLELLQAILFIAV